ncbi:MAG TPA: hypothetical protein PK675_05010 [Clostridia bacterium]|nr:hypothetical protein [Clostridia bacterium]
MNDQIALKNLQSLNDILDAEKLYYEKLSYYATQIQDTKLKNLVEKFQESAKSHYYKVYDYLKSHQKS